MCSDAGLAAERKAYLMQNIMASRYIVAQQRRLAGGEALGTGDPSMPARSFHDAARGVLGCAHYRRRCVFPLYYFAKAPKASVCRSAGFKRSPLTLL